MRKKGWLTGLIALAVFLAACGMASAEDYIDQNYTFINAVQNNQNTNDRAMLYRSDKSIPDTAAELSGIQEPERIGEEVDGRQVLVYDDELIILTEDPENAGATLVEVAEDEFVRSHYNPGFFSGMFVGSFLSNRYGSGWTQANRCAGGGCYSGGGSYNTFPSGSFGRGSEFRGGGPGVGK
ncbi:MAG: DUF4247 domain-containing protein [Planococcus sp. (in: firmicutes)]|uniref:DUF4247 domain-containing protein n=1 Tax=Planococcus alpniumensis TaxID=2708345 RepID=UPI001B8AEB5D|nr:DUF4247 domain-containing protein [Planococcus sp. MSAK28401]MDN5708777.1 DUF4247 domain-containing protein [Planococcus sp. (in: firmicutes)]